MQITNEGVAVVTGGADGIGLALVRRLLAAGMRVAIADVAQGNLDRTLDDLSAYSSKVIGVRTDVSVESDVAELRDTTLAAFGRVDLVVNNAGVVSPFRPIWETTTADWEWVLGVDLWGVIHGVRVFVPELIRQGRGHIVNTASMAGVLAIPYNSPYNAAKHAVVSISETLSAELDRDGHDVGVTVVCPGVVATDIGKQPGEQDPAVRAKPVAANAAVLSADDVARQIISAIESNHLYLATNPGSAAILDASLDRLRHEMARPLGRL